MTTIAHFLASGPGWRVDDVVCTAGPHDPAFEERHGDACIAVVSDGVFQYRTTNGAALLAPGSLLLGNRGQCFECGHDHGVGDRCLSFHFSAAYVEAVVAAAPGVTSTMFCAAHLPPLPSLAPLAADAEAARDDGDADAFEELSLRLLGAVATTLADGGGASRAPSWRDEQRIVRALRRIAAASDEAAGDRLSVSALAAEAAMSPYHFLRAFKAVVGLTPHQYILRLRLHRAAVRLRTSSDPVATIAFDAGFGDLSSFNRRFRRIIGATPGDYRARRG